MTEPVPFDFVDEAHKRANHNMKWSKYDPDVIPAWTAEHDFRQPASVIEAMRRTVDRRDVGYSLIVNEVAAAYQQWSTERYGWTPDPKLATPVVDVLQGVVAAVTALAAPGDGVVMAAPIYHVFRRICPTSGRRQVEWPMRRDDDGWHLDAERLEQILSNDPGVRVLLLSHPHNPTGRVSERSTLTRLVELAHEYDLHIVSDEIHGDLVYDEAEFVPLLSIPGADERVVTVTSPAKTFAMSGLRCALMQYDHEPLHTRASQAHPPLLLGRAARTGIDATIAAWTKGGDWTDELVATLTGLRDHLVARLAADAPAVGIHSPHATYLAWLDVSACGLGPQPSVYLLEHAKVGVNEGTDFGSGGEGHVRLNFGTSPQLLDEILDRLVPHLQA